MSVRVRFAPSPTGFLHVGGARTALYNFLFARGQGGTFVLRIEDTDAARSTEASLHAILDGLRWLGLLWDEGPEVGGPHGPYFQSQRSEHYREAARRLRETGRAYLCYCTPEELESRRAERRARGASPGYDGRCRTLSDAARRRFEAEGRPAALRFHAVPAGREIAWDDAVRERVAFPSAVIDDFVIVRSDGNPTYNFAAVVDDHAMAISHVIRGDDHISNTPRQLLLYEALAWTPPVFAHVPMILGSDGQRLSKRHGATAVGAYRDMGYIAPAMDNFLALLGWSYDGEREIFTLDELIRLFRLERVGSNPAVFNVEKLEWLNARHLKRLPEDERVALVEDFLRRRGWNVDARDPAWRRAFVRALGDRLKTLLDAERYGRFALAEELETDPGAWRVVREDPRAGPRLRALADRLRALDRFEADALEAETRGLAEALGIKAGKLMGIVRVALTGRRMAPGLFDVMLLIGREKTLERLQAAAERWERETQAAGA